MKYVTFVTSLLLVVLVVYGLNTKLGPLPPMGKFLDPSQGIWQNECDETINGSIKINGLEDDVTVHYDAQ